MKVAPELYVHCLVFAGLLWLVGLESSAVSFLVNFRAALQDSRHSDCQADQLEEFEVLVAAASPSIEIS